MSLEMFSNHTCGQISHQANIRVIRSSCISIVLTFFEALIIRLIPYYSLFQAMSLFFSSFPVVLFPCGVFPGSLKSTPPVFYLVLYFVSSPSIFILDRFISFSILLSLLKRHVRHQFTYFRLTGVCSQFFSVLMLL